MADVPSAPHMYLDPGEVPPDDPGEEAFEVATVTVTTKEVVVAINPLLHEVPDESPEGRRWWLFLATQLHEIADDIFHDIDEFEAGIQR